MDMPAVARPMVWDGSGFYARFGKRAFDIAFVLVTAPMGLSLVLVGVVLALLSGVRPFYLQPRIGKGGRVFKMIKIRSMVTDADQVLETYLAENPDAHAEWSEKQKLTNDPRIVRFGRILRRSSLDEMPQLWNVLIGDMSVIGPRPMMANQKALYDSSDARNSADYYCVRPGITGPWQISDRSKGSFAGRVEYDKSYCRGLSFREDMRILGKTVGAVLRFTGQ